MDGPKGVREAGWCYGDKREFASGNVWEAGMRQTLIMRDTCCMSILEKIMKMEPELRMQNTERQKSAMPPLKFCSFI